MPACGQCGENNPPEARLCWSCGTALPAVDRPAGEERRVVTVLFVDLVDFTSISTRLDPEDLRRVQAPYFRRVRAELERFGGHVEKYIGDAVMALFGAPVAHGDDAHRAVLAAFAIRRAIGELNDEEELDLKVRVAVNTGEAFVDLGARTDAGEGMAAGDVVVTSFRLQQAAPVGEIVVGEATHRATQRGIEYAELEPVAAKGKQEPLRAWKAVAMDEPAGRPAAKLVGRDDELAYLKSLVGSAEFAAPRLVTLVGGAGVGKSRLLWELRQSLEDEPEEAVWRQGRCLGYGSGVSFSAFAELVKSHAEILESDAADTVAEKLGATVAALVQDVAARDWTEAYLRPLVGLEGAERLSGDRRGEAFSAWRRFVEGIAARGRVVLAFEDLQWGDDGLLDFVEHLNRWSVGLPLTIVCTARPELCERRPMWPGVIQVEPLSVEDTTALVDALLGSTALRVELRDELLVRAAGNPLYAEEFVRMFQERRSDEGVQLPETVQALISGRLDTLHPEAKAILRDAAVVGHGFWVGALAHVSGRQREQIERRLGELQWKELVRAHPGSAVAEESQYTFWHVLVRDVAYAQIPRAARAEKHRLTAEWIESLAWGRADLTELLAHHYTSALEYARLARQETAELVDRARIALRDAGDRALTLYAYPAAARFFRDALELWPADDPARPQLLFCLGKALFWSERGGADELARAREAMIEAGDVGRASQADVLLSRLAIARGDPDVASVHATAAVALLRDAPSSSEQAEAVSNLVAVHAVRGESDRALEASSQALALAEALSLDEIKAETLTFRGHARILGGDEDGIADLELAVEVAEEASAPAIVRSCANLATSLVELGQLERAWAVYERGRTAAARFGDAIGMHWLAAERPYELYWRGAWDDALAAAEVLLREQDAGYGGYAGSSVRAWIRLARGDFAGALDDSATALGFARRAKDAAALCSALALRARVLAEGGRREEAMPIADEAVAAASGRGILPSFWTADLADALHQLDRAHGLPAHANAGSRWLAAAHHVLAGSHANAAAAYAAIGARPEEAKARLRASNALATSGDHAAANEELGRAREFYARVGAEAYFGAGESISAVTPG
jgi:class 3 adenylate cyclase/tetratricopeptide (TPR) repeat protein